MRDLYDVMAKEPVWKSDKTDSGKPDTGKQAFLQGRVQPIYQPVRCKHRLREQLPPRARSRLLAHCWLAGMVGVPGMEGQRNTQQQLFARVGKYFSISATAM